MVNMSYREAVRQMYAGRSVRRKAWADRTAFCTVSTETAIMYYHSYRSKEEADLSNDDFRAKDWIVILND